MEGMKHTAGQGKRWDPPFGQRMAAERNIFAGKDGKRQKGAKICCIDKWRMIEFLRISIRRFDRARGSRHGYDPEAGRLL